MKPRTPPWYPVAYTDSDMAAIKALSRGEATAAQQVHALKFIVETVSDCYDLSYRSDDAGGERDTVFAEGRRFVGLQIVKLMKLVPKGRDERTDRDPDRHG